MESSPRVLITGMGAVCGAGLGVEAIWQAILSGKSSVGPIQDLGRKPLAGPVRRPGHRG